MNTGTRTLRPTHLATTHNSFLQWRESVWSRGHKLASSGSIHLGNLHSEIFFCHFISITMLKIEDFMYKLKYSNFCKNNSKDLAIMGLFLLLAEISCWLKKNTTLEQDSLSPHCCLDSISHFQWLL